jgi:hypothetical protein
MITWLKKKWCEKFGHSYESNPAGAIVCTRCGHTLAESRNQILKKILPEIEKMFGIKSKPLEKS